MCHNPAMLCLQIMSSIHDTDEYLTYGPMTKVIRDVNTEVRKEKKLVSILINNTSVITHTFMWCLWHQDIPFLPLFLSHLRPLLPVDKKYCRDLRYWSQLVAQPHVGQILVPTGCPASCRSNISPNWLPSLMQVKYWSQLVAQPHAGQILVPTGCPASCRSNISPNWLPSLMQVKYWSQLVAQPHAGQILVPTGCPASCRSNISPNWLPSLMQVKY